MEQPTHIAKELNIIDKNPQLDESCKRVLSLKIILANILKECLEEFGDTNTDTIANECIEGKPLISGEAVNQDESEIIEGRNTEDTSIKDGVARYDILFNAFAPSSDEPIKLIINVEAQNEIKSKRNLLRRARYYCARMLSGQHNREFLNDKYENIKKVVSIWVLINPLADMRNSVKRIFLTEENLIGDTSSLREYYDTDEVILICLGNKKDGNYKGIVKMLSVIFSRELSADEKKRILEQECEIKMTGEIEKEVQNMCDYSAYVYEQGMQEGRSEGIQEGMQKGKQEGILNSIINVMKNTGSSLEDTLVMLGISKTDYPKYKEMLNQP